MKKGLLLVSVSGLSQTRRSDSRAVPFAGPPAKSAFTLIELLVVITVIAILAALLLPAMSRAKEQGYSAVCKSNLRQMGLALASYTGDFKAYPLFIYGPVEPPPSQGGPPGYWPDQLKAYTGAKWGTNLGAGIADSTSQLYLCPSYARAVGLIAQWPDSAAWADSDNTWEIYGPYGYNWMGVGGTNFANGSLGLGGVGTGDALTEGPFLTTKDNEVLSPSHMIAIGDANFTPFNPNPLYPFVGANELGIVYPVYLFFALGQNPPGLDSMMVAPDARRHDEGRRNIVFCDGHVECLTPAQLFNFQDDSVLSLWNKDNLPHQEVMQGGP